MEVSIIPRWLIRYLSNDCLRQNDINILVSNILIISIFVLFKNSLIEILNYIPHFCLFDKLIGIECPVCGTTRAFCEIATGNIRHAFNLNFSSFFIASFFIFQIPLRLFSLLNDKNVDKINLVSKYYGYAILLVILMNWIIKISIQT
jgi:hypothetical protein